MAGQRRRRWVAPHSLCGFKQWRTWAQPFSSPLPSFRIRLSLSFYSSQGSTNVIHNALCCVYFILSLFIYWWIHLRKGKKRKEQKKRKKKKRRLCNSIHSISMLYSAVSWSNCYLLMCMYIWHRIREFPFWLCFGASFFFWVDSY